MPLTMIKPKGRPATQCAHCRELRKNKQHHTRCKCGAGNSAKHSSTCPCTLDKELCTCSKKKKKQSPNASSSPANVTTVPSSATSNSSASSSSPINIPVNKNATFHHNGIDKYTRTESVVSLNDLKRRKASKNHASSASLSKLSVLTDLTPSPPDTVKANSPIPMFLNFNNNNEPYDLLNSLDSLPISNRINNSTTSLSSFNSGFMTSTSNNDGYVSDIDPPLQLNFSHSGLLGSSNNNGITAARTVRERKGHPGEVIIKPGNLDDFMLLSPSDNYEVLQNSNSFGLLDFIDTTHGQQENIRGGPNQQSGNRTSSRNMSSRLGSRQPVSSISASQHYPIMGPTSVPANLVNERELNNAPLFPILTANRPHKEIDYKTITLGNSLEPVIDRSINSNDNVGASSVSTPLSSILSDKGSNRAGIDNTAGTMLMNNMNSMNLTNPLTTDINLMSTMNSMNLDAGLNDCDNIKPGLLDLNLQTLNQSDLNEDNSLATMVPTTSAGGTEDFNYGMYDFLMSST